MEASKNIYKHLVQIRALSCLNISFIELRTKNHIVPMSTPPVYTSADPITFEDDAFHFYLAQRYVR